MDSTNSGPCLAEHHVEDLLWYEVNKSKKAPKRVRHAVEAGADLIVAWGGDGMVQRCLDTLAGSDVPVGIIPAGTANLLAHNLGIPENLRRSGPHRSDGSDADHWTWVGSTASTSRSWPESASTPN